MGGFHFLLIFILNATIFAPYTSAQQKYLGNAVLNCTRFNETVPSSAVLYTCTAHLPTCKAFLIFRSQPPPYNSVSSISNLLSADPGEVSRINNISREAILPLNKELIVPVNCSCSCSGLFYQANTSYVIPSGGTTYFTTANNTFQGLSSCSALLSENVYRPEDLVPGMNLTVPLRCACPENVRDQFPAIYEFEELEKATGNFSLEKRLSSSVYTGILGGKLSAIKAVNEEDASSEVEILSKINHCSIIRLRGISEHLGVTYLVFEFMANGSLKEWLLQNYGPGVHSWNNRIRIALDVADGLNYIHNFTDPPYVHNNINSCSILLNEHLRAKIADFSLTKTAQNDGTGNLCPKTDVYAFGVILLELITGKEAIFNQGREEEVMLFERVVQIIEGRNGEDEIQNVLDPRLQVKHPLGFIIDQTELALRLIKLSAACLAHEPAKRPTAAEVVSSLMNIQSDVQNLEAWSM